MKVAKSSPLCSVGCSAYSNSYQGYWASLKFVNDKNVNGVVMIFFVFFFQSSVFSHFLTPNFYFHLIYIYIYI